MGIVYALPPWDESMPGTLRWPALDSPPSAPAIRSFGKIRAMRMTDASEGGFRQWAS